MKITKSELKTIILEEASKLKRLSILKEEKLKIEKALQEIEDFNGENIPDHWQEFDEFEFSTSAKDAAISDIENDPEAGEFSEIGDNEFEKGMDVKDFTAPVNAANLKLPNQEKEIENLKKKLDFEKKFGTIHVNESEAE